MVNLNGTFNENNEALFKAGNRAFLYGDQLFETILYKDGTLVFWDDHYFRMMGGACILRMDIPIHLNIEFFQDEILKTIEENDLTNDTCRVRFSIFRKEGGNYLPTDKSLDYLIEVVKINESDTLFNRDGLLIDIFYDHLKPKQSLSNFKGINSIISVLASVFKEENNLDDAIILNSSSELCEMTSSNLFVVKDNLLITPPLSSGCVDGIVRKKVVENCWDWGYELEEKEMKSFDLIKADEIFISNSIKGIQWVGAYKNKKYQKDVAFDVYTQLQKLTT